MRKLLTVLSSFAVILAFTVSPALATSGFNQYGYNYSARIFVGSGMDWCQAYAAKYNLSSPTVSTCDSWLGGPSANDQLVMKWNAQWDNCNANGYDNPTYCAGATLTNEWNGMVPGGSGNTEHFKAIWVGSQGESSPYWQLGGYSLWGNYEAIMDQGMADGAHTVWAHATPDGFGVSK